MKILFLEPPVSSLKNIVFQCSPPYGLMYLAAFIREKRPDDVLKIFNMMMSRDPFGELGGIIEDFDPDIIAFHAMTFQATEMHRAAALIKGRKPECIIVCGGPHPWPYRARVLKDPNIDILACGEGEHTFLAIVESAARKNGLSGIPGTAYANEDKIVVETLREPVSNPDTLPFPAWDLVNLPDYFPGKILNQNDISYRKEVASVFSSRGCPYSCIFCHNVFGKRYRPRSPENILAEITALNKNYGISEIHFIDDCFNLERKRTIEILSGIIESCMDIKIAFPNGLRGDLLDDETIHLMKKAGVYKINFGIESGSPRIQKMIKKSLSLEKISENITKTVRAGIFTHGFFMMGFPGETELEIRQTIDFACSLPLHTAGFALFTPFPETDAWDLAADYIGNIVFVPEMSSYQKLTVNLTSIDDRRLLYLHKTAHRKFYLNPSRLIRIVRSLPNKKDFITTGLRHFRLKFINKSFSRATI